MPRGIGWAHPVDILLECCRVFGLETELRVVVKFSLKDSSGLGNPQNHRIVAIVPAGKRPDVEWKHFAAFAEALFSKEARLSIQLVATRPYEWITKLQSELENLVFVKR